MLQSHSQTTSKEDRVTSSVDINGETYIHFKLSDAKLILNDVLDKVLLDSIVLVQETREEQFKEQITNGLGAIQDLKAKVSNKDEEISNLGKVVENNSVEIKLLGEENKQQNKEIKKQKLFKNIGFGLAVLLPILVLLL